MVNHSIEELKRQMYDALSKAGQASIAAREAEQRYNAARAEKSGLMGKKVKAKTGVILIDRVEYITKESQKPWRVTGNLFKKDGSIGMNRSTVYVEDGIVEVT